MAQLGKKPMGKLGFKPRSAALEVGVLKAQLRAPGKTSGWPRSCQHISVITETGECWGGQGLVNTYLSSLRLESVGVAKVLSTHICHH